MWVDVEIDKLIICYWGGGGGGGELGGGGVNQWDGTLAPL